MNHENLAGLANLNHLSLLHMHSVRILPYGPNKLCTSKRSTVEKLSFMTKNLNYSHINYQNY